LDGKNLAAYLKLADIAAQQGQDQNVRNLLGQAIAAAPGAAQPRVALARYLILRRDFNAAATVANDLIRTQPTNTDGVTLLGQAQLGADQKKEAIATYRRLTSMMPTAAGPQVLLGNALAETGDRVGAASAMATAVKLSPTSPQVRSAQIMTLLRQNDTNGAVASARAFQAAVPGTEADILLADALDGAKLHDQAAAVLAKRLADKPNPAVLLRLVRSTVLANDSKRAMDLMSNWLAGHPADGAVRLEYATLLMQQENNPQAIAQYQAILKDQPNNVVALNNMGWMIQDSDPKRALAVLTQAYKLAPNSSNVADTLGWVKLQQKDAAGALTLLNKAHTLQPSDGEITYHLARALDANGKRNEARGLLKSLLDSNVQFKVRPAAVQLSNSWR
jgi:putative PEP-CTERM system TPR-repeat lipoprotein